MKNIIAINVVFAILASLQLARSAPKADAPRCLIQGGTNNGTITQNCPTTNVYKVVRPILNGESLEDHRTGRLLPARDEPPAYSECKPFLPGLDALTVYFGGGTLIGFHNPFVVLEIAGKPVIEIDERSDGSAQLNMDVTDSTGRFIAKIENNVFHVNEHNDAVFYWTRPDQSSLIIFDQFDKEILNVRFRNKKAFEINGAINSLVSASAFGVGFSSGGGISHFCFQGIKGIVMH